MAQHEVRSFSRTSLPINLHFSVVPCSCTGSCRAKFLEFWLSTLWDTRHTDMSYTQTLSMGEGAATEPKGECNSLNLVLQ